MAFLNTIAPSAGAALIADRLAPAPAPQVIATDLSPHTVILDPPTRDLIFRIIEVRSGQVVRQVPDEALLRMRAYARALATAEA
jgi:hypothetical protein